MNDGIREVVIHDDVIRLGQFLKLADLIDTGADAKPLLASGAVLVNDAVETRRGRQLLRGDVVTRGQHEGAGQLTPSRSTTKISVSPGLITPPAPRSP